MKDEFDKIMEFFSLPPEDKAVKLQDIFEDSIAFFERFKHILENGTPEEKKNMINKVAELQKTLQSETQKACQLTGLSEDDLKNYANTRENFSDDQWDLIQNAKVKIEKQAIGISKFFKGGKQAVAKGTIKKKKSGKSKRDKWVRS